MTDIAKCNGKVELSTTTKVCSRRDSCWRFTAPGSRYQLWMSPPLDMESCDLYWAVNETAKQLREAYVKWNSPPSPELPQGAEVCLKAADELDRLTARLASREDASP